MQKTQILAHKKRRSTCEGVLEYKSITLNPHFTKGKKKEVPAHKRAFDLQGRVKI